MDSAQTGALAALDRIVYYYLYGGMSGHHSIREAEESLRDVRVAPGTPLAEVAGVVGRWMERAGPDPDYDDPAADDAAMDAVERVLREAGLLPMCLRDEAPR